MKENPLRELGTLGQSVWLDFISRAMIQSGELRKMIEEDGLRGLTSNPDIFDKAISESTDYDEEIRALALAGKTDEEIYEELTAEDIQMAADLFRPVYGKLDGRDGFVSLEVSPRLARDTEGTIAEARRLWKAVDRPNVLIKVPATMEGLPAIRKLVAEGININVTLLFGLPRYRLVAEAYIAGLEDRSGNGKPLEHIASVASFFLSRIDVLVDPMLEKITDAGGRDAELAESLKGKVAIACAKIATEIHREVFSGKRFDALASRGAHDQRLLWASTGTKNPSYSDVKYVEPLIGAGTINTMPLKTLKAYSEHGDPAHRLREGLRESRRILTSLDGLGIDLDKVTRQLEVEGVDKFIRPFDNLMYTLKKKRFAVLAETGTCRKALP
ncbi:MAG TPA: transaldolase [Geobacteraceae bacterium]|nr:transaldolase [Geobacteraceae bacterium]